MSNDRPLASPAANPYNLLLARLSVEDAPELMRSLVPIEMPMGLRLSEPGHKVEHIYFPVSGMIGTDALTNKGESALISLIGSEGFAGWSGMLNHPQHMHAVMVHTSGRALRAKVSVARDEFERGGAFTRLSHAFMYMQFAQISQSVLCNRFHTVHQRLARWLLEMLERTEENTLMITHEALATMLGSRRSSVTVAATQMQDAGAIEYRRGKIRFADRQKLEEASCECYGIVREAYRHMTQEFGMRDPQQATDGRVIKSGAAPRDHAGAARP